MQPPGSSSALPWTCANRPMSFPPGGPRRKALGLGTEGLGAPSPEQQRSQLTPWFPSLTGTLSRRRPGGHTLCQAQPRLLTQSTWHCPTANGSWRQFTCVCHRFATDRGDRCQTTSCGPGLCPQAATGGAVTF